MLDVFSDAPSGIQIAPHEVRLNAAGHQVSLRAVNLDEVKDPETLHQQQAVGLSMPPTQTETWQSLLLALTDDAIPKRFGILLLGYRDFRYRHEALSDSLDKTLLEAQQIQATKDKALYLLAAYAENNPDHF